MSTPPPRRFGLLQATALNMINMIGIGPFITIPLLMSALGGPQAMLGWIVALVIVICDGMVWSELGAAMPGPGGSFGYLREAFGRETFGRLMAFLFVWQFILSGPLEIASGYIGFSQYLGYIWPGFSGRSLFLVAAAVGLVNIALLYRRITSIATITVSLWVGTLLTTAAVIATGAMHFDPQIAFDFPPGAFNFSLGFLMGLGAASRVGVYDYLGYYDVCYIGDEVENPGRVIPRSILISTVAVAAIYFGINLSIIGVMPWREFVPAGDHPESSFIVSSFMERIYGSGIATVFTRDDPVDGVRVGVRPAARVLADSVRGGQGRVLLQGVRAPASDEGLPDGLADRARADLDRRLPLLARRGHRRAHRHADRRAVHRPGRGRDAPPAHAPRHAAAVSHLALPASDPRRARRLAVHLRHDGRAGDRVRRRHPGAGGGLVPGLVETAAPVAVPAVTPNAGLM